MTYRARTVLRTFYIFAALSGLWTCYEFWDAPPSIIQPGLRILRTSPYGPHPYIHSDNFSAAPDHPADAPQNRHRGAGENGPSPMNIHPPKHKRPQVALSETLFPSYNKTDSSWLDSNNENIKNLFRCIELGNCPPNQYKVIILGSHYFRWVLNGWTAGEVIWSRSTIQALHNLNYTILYSLNNDRAVQLYQMFPRLVKAILLTPEDIRACNADIENCIQSDMNPNGIPLYKTFTWEFWDAPNHPLGAKWTLNPEPYAVEGVDEANTYIGYSVEPACFSHPFVPPSERKHQAYAMTKRLRFFLPSPEQAWPSSFYTTAAAETGLDILVGAANDPTMDVGIEVELPEGVRNVGLLEQKDFVSTVGESKVLIGVGAPATSPTPYEALCLGTPFINPIHSWDPSDPSNRLSWSAQHELLKFEDPPYVYNVKKGDLEGFVDAVRRAVENPLGDRWVPERMRMESVERRLEEFVGRDWEGEWRRLVEERDEARGVLG